MTEKEKDRDDVLSLKNIYLSALLHCQGFKLLGTSREQFNSRTLYFDFAGREKAERLLTEHCNGAVTVNLKQYLTSLESLKDLIFGRQRGDRENGFGKY